MNRNRVAFAGGLDGEFIPSVMRHRRFKAGLKGPPQRERGGALAETRMRTEDVTIPGHNFLKSILKSKIRIPGTGGVKTRLILIMVGRILCLQRQPKILVALETGSGIQRRRNQIFTQLALKQEIIIPRRLRVLCNTTGSIWVWFRGTRRKVGEIINGGFSLFD